MSYIMVDIESDGPIPGDYSMICFGAVVVEAGLERTFYGRLRPISEKFIPEALAVSGFTREQALAFPEPEGVMRSFAEWLASISKDRLMFTGKNPFGFTSTNLGSLYKGMVKDTFTTFKHLRRTKHTHHPVDDAKGNAEALLTMKDDMGLKIRL